jgi:hypothetical protein
LVDNKKLSSMKKFFHLFSLCVLLSTGVVAPASARLINAKEVISDEPEPHPNTLYVKLKLNGRTATFSLLVFPADLVGDVKSTISDLTGFPAGDFSLYLNGQELNETLTLGFYGIGNGAIINAAK